MGVAEIISFLITAEPEIQKLVLELIQTIKDYKEGKATAEQTNAAAQQAMGLLFGRIANPHAEAAATDAQIDGELAAKFKP